MNIDNEEFKIYDGLSNKDFITEATDKEIEALINKRQESKKELIILKLFLAFVVLIYSICVGVCFAKNWFDEYKYLCIFLSCLCLLLIIILAVVINFTIVKDNKYTYLMYLVLKNKPFKYKMKDDVLIVEYNKYHHTYKVDNYLEGKPFYISYTNIGQVL